MSDAVDWLFGHQDDGITRDRRFPWRYRAVVSFSGGRYEATAFTRRRAHALLGALRQAADRWTTRHAIMQVRAEMAELRTAMKRSSLMDVFIKAPSGEWVWTDGPDTATDKPSTSSR